MATFTEVSAALRRQVLALRIAPRATAIVTAPVLAASVHSVFGHAPPLADLAESTQDERTALGYAPNDPLVRTGALEESWVPGVSEGQNGPIAGVGSDNNIAMYHEFGYMNHRTGRPVPPRAAGYEGFMAAQPMAKKLWMNTIGRAIKPG